MKTVAIIFFTISVFVLTCQAGDLNYTDQLTFEESMLENCFTEQRAAPSNAAMKDGQLRQYCSCVSRFMSFEVTYALLQKLETSDVPKVYIKKTEEVSQQCISHLLEEWRQESAKVDNYKKYETSGQLPGQETEKSKQPL